MRTVIPLFQHLTEVSGATTPLFVCFAMEDHTRKLLPGIILFGNEENCPNGKVQAGARGAGERRRFYGKIVKVSTGSFSYESVSAVCNGQRVVRVTHFENNSFLFLNQIESSLQLFIQKSDPTGL